MIQSLGRKEIEEAKELLKKVNEILAEGLREYDMREYRTKSQHYEMEAEIILNPSRYHRFIDAHTEILLDIIKRKNREEYYLITVSKKEVGKTDRETIEKYICNTYEKATETWRDEINKHINKLQGNLY